MENFQYVDIFATKGLEYLLVIGFLFCLVIFWKFLNSRSITAPELSKAPGVSMVDWFSITDNFYYHRGHSWMVPESANVVRVGMDDFAQKIIGNPDSVNLPSVGAKVKQGGKGWKMQVKSKWIDMLSPVNGKIIAVNENVIKMPNLINDDPYREGWLLKIKTPDLRTDIKNLLTGKLAKSWIEQTVDDISAKMAGNLGIVLQDGGMPISGFAKEMAPDNWDSLIKEFFLTNEKEV